ncbi:MAG: hypothetical protein Q3965_01460 [Rothia sp. (in: high G+C Gram-positive bacteria)]|nr:hypothetical protein [Rothia sp. (in: high G+C Gram-positive bacteria)]
MNSQEKTRWGRAKFGESSQLLIALSLLGGALVPLGTAFLLFMNKQDGDFWFYLLASFVATYLISVASIWALLVDRNTLAGAVEKPENSVESLWYSKATENTFHIMLAVLGLSAGVSSIYNWQFATGYVLTVATLLMGLVFIVSYQVHKRR